MRNENDARCCHTCLRNARMEDGWMPRKHVANVRLGRTRMNGKTTKARRKRDRGKIGLARQILATKLWQKNREEDGVEEWSMCVPNKGAKERRSMVPTNLTNLRLVRHQSKKARDKEEIPWQRCYRLSNPIQIWKIVRKVNQGTVIFTHGTFHMGQVGKCRVHPPSMFALRIQYTFLLRSFEGQKHALPSIVPLLVSCIFQFLVSFPRCISVFSNPSMDGGENICCDLHNRGWGQIFDYFRLVWPFVVKLHGSWFES